MRNGKVTLNEVVLVLDGLTLEGAKAIAAQMQGEPVKYGKVELGQVEADYNRFLADIPLDQREEVLAAIRRGEKRAVVTIEDIIRLLVDKNGRGIPVKPEVSARVTDANMAYYFDRLSADYFLPGSSYWAEWLNKWQKLFGQSPGIGAEAFLGKLLEIRAKYETMPAVRNLFAGPAYPMILPQTPEEFRAEFNYGAYLERFILPAAVAGYNDPANFPERKFENCLAGQLTGQVTIVDQGHWQLVKELKTHPIVGWLTFPLQGFSGHAQRQMADLMPKGISLAGPVEGEAAEAMYPRQLSRDSKTPVKDYSAVQWQDADYSLCSYASGGRRQFVNRCNLGDASGDYAGGFFVRG